MGLPQGPAAGAVRDTIAAVFRQHEYDRTLRETLWDRFWSMVAELLGRVFGGVHRVSISQPLMLLILALVAAFILTRIGIGVASGVSFARRRDTKGAFSWGRDPWTEAQRLATDGRYTDAAHALYAALLEGLARREDLRLDPSKTVGDYRRELRHRSSPLMPTFRDFARLYEVVVYGLGFCDRERYERLYVLASGMLAPRP